MPRRQILSESERAGLLSLPESQQEVIRLYTFSLQDLAIIRLRRGDENRLGFAVQLCYMRHPGILLGVEETPFSTLLTMVAKQLGVAADHWANYGQRDQTRREHISELQTIFGFQTFTTSNHYRYAVHSIESIALQTDKGIILAKELIENLRSQKILLPAVSVIERICAEAITIAERQIYKCLTESLSSEQMRQLDSLLLMRGESKTSTLIWLRQSPAASNAKHLLEHIERLKIMEALQLPDNLEKLVHQNRLLKLAREGGQMTAQHLNDLEITRRHATLVAVILEAKATVIDEIVDLNDRVIGSLFKHAKNAHQGVASRKGYKTALRIFGVSGTVKAVKG